MKKIFTLMALLALFSTTPSMALTWNVVDKNAAPGDTINFVFQTIQAATSAALKDQADGFADHIAIFIKNGTYTESVLIGTYSGTTPIFKISFIGESKEGVIWQSRNVIGTKAIYPSISKVDSTWVTRQIGGALFVNGKNDGTCKLHVENITFKNFANAPGVDANVVHVRDMGNYTFKNCSFQGNKFLLENKKLRRCMFYNCDFQGISKFMKGSATTMYYKCNFKLLADNGYIAEPEDNLYGKTSGGDTLLFTYIMRDCQVTKGDTVHAGTCFLAYPAGHHSGTVLINSKIDNHISPLGWKANAAGNVMITSFLGEYNSMNMDGSAADVSGRLAGSVQLTKAQVDTAMYLKEVFQMYDIAEFTGVAPNITRVKAYYKFPEPTNVFRPDSMLCTPGAPTNVVQNGNTLTWNAVSGAASYIVLKDGVFETIVSDPTYTSPTSGTLTVRSCNPYGALSLANGSAETEMAQLDMYNLLFVKGTVGLASNRVDSFDYTFENGFFNTRNEYDFTVYNLSGRCVKVQRNAQGISLQGFPQGMYLIRSANANGSTLTKVVL